MRQVLFFLFVLSTAQWLNAQDTLYKSNGTKQAVRITAINATSVYFTIDSASNKVVFTIAREDVTKIVYATGLIEIFPKATLPNPKYKQDPIATNFGKNFISVNIMDLFLGSSLTICYERTLKSGSFSYKFPLSLGMSSIGLLPENQYNQYSQGGYYNTNKIFSTGIDFYFYPRGQGKAKYFIGPSVEYGQFNYTYIYYNPNSSVTYSENKIGMFSAMILQNGFLFQPSKHINISMNLGVGYVQTRMMSNYRYSTGHTTITEGLGAIRFGVNAGYKF